MEKENQNKNVTFLSLANYTAPEIIESASKKWVNYGQENDYFQYLLDRYRGSATNHTVINGVVEQIVGGGVTVQNGTPDQVAKFEQLFSPQDFNRWCFDLKWGGFYMSEIILAKDLKSIAKVKHTPVQNWRSGKADENGRVTEYWYSDDWTRSSSPKYRPTSYPAYFKGTQSPVSILASKPYRAGTFYYPNVDYQGCLQYAHIEEEISNFHINNLKNGMFPSLLINFNNGVPEESKQQEIENGIVGKWGGTTKTGKVVLAFNDDKDSAATIEAVAQPDLDKMFNLLSEESTEKILVGHRITSPMLFGVKNNTGLGNNADELATASTLFESTVVRPYRDFVSQETEMIMSEAGTPVKVGFESFNPFEIPEATQTINPADIGLSKQESDLDGEVADWLIDQGEEMDDEKWELIDSRPVDYDTEGWMDKQLNLASVPSAKPKSESEQDTSLFAVRYIYAGILSSDSRDFCKKMVQAKKVYRFEDIDAAGSKVVNAGWGAYGADTYSIWFYKGGGYCRHFWQRQTYLLKNNEQISVNQAVKMITALPPDERADAKWDTNDPKVAKHPNDLPNCGFLPYNKKTGCK